MATLRLSLDATGAAVLTTCQAWNRVLEVREKGPK